MSDILDTHYAEVWPDIPECRAFHWSRHGWTQAPAPPPVDIAALKDREAQRRALERQRNAEEVRKMRTQEENEAHIQLNEAARRERARALRAEAKRLEAEEREEQQRQLKARLREAIARKNTAA